MAPNITGGSHKGLDPWYGVPTMIAEQQKEVAQIWTKIPIKVDQLSRLINSQAPGRACQAARQVQKAQEIRQSCKLEQVCLRSRQRDALGLGPARDCFGFKAAFQMQMHFGFGERLQARGLGGRKGESCG